MAVVVGSGIAAQQLSPDDTGLQLFENAAATAAGLVAIILAVGPVSGAHLNPVVSLVDRVFGGLSNRELAAYVGAQLVGAAVGVALANLMYEEAAIEWSSTVRDGRGVWLAEVIATLGLVLVVFGLARAGKAAAAPFAVGAYIGAAYFFTSSTSFANPAVTFGRMGTDTFAGIAPSSVPAVRRVPVRRNVARTRAGARAVPGNEGRVVSTSSTARRLDDRCARGVVRLRTQRGPVADGRGSARPSRPRSGPGALGRKCARGEQSTPPSSR